MLDAHVLVLNKSWVAVNVASARRALCLVFQGHAKIVHPLTTGASYRGNPVFGISIRG